MSRFEESRRVARSARVALALLAFVVPVWAGPDLVVLRDGSEIECRVIELDDRRLVVEDDQGRRESFARAEVRAIEFGEEEGPPIVGRVRVGAADDLVRIFIDGEEVADPVELTSGWVDISEWLSDGSHELYAEVVNERGVWAYRWVVEAGGERHVFQCGLPHKSGCREGGRSDRAQGTFPAGRAWLYVHRRSGEVEIEIP